MCNLTILGVNQQTNHLAAIKSFKSVINDSHLLRPLYTDQCKYRHSIHSVSPLLADRKSNADSLVDRLKVKDLTGTGREL